MDLHRPPEPACAPDHGCITCGDEAVPMRVMAVDEERELALCVDADGARSTVEVALVGPLVGGDAVLVHAGTALLQLTGEDTTSVASAGAART